MIEVNLNVDVPNTFISAVINAPFDIAKKALEQKGYDIISISENAHLRISEHENHVKLSKRLGEGISIQVPRIIILGNYVSESVVYVPGEGMFITRNSPVMKRPEEFVAAERVGRPFYITQGELEEALEDCNSVKVPYEFDYRITEENFKCDNNRIPIKKFNEDEVIKFCFNGFEIEYAKFLKKIDIKSIPFYLDSEDYVNGQESPYAKQLVFGGTGNYSAIWTSRIIGDSIRGILRQGRDKVVEVKI